MAFFLISARRSQSLTAGWVVSSNHSLQAFVGLEYLSFERRLREGRRERNPLLMKSGLKFPSLFDKGVGGIR